MQHEPSLTFRKGDWGVIVLVILLAVAAGIVFFPRQQDSQNAAVQIYEDGVLTGEYPLSQDRVLELGGEYHNTVTIQDGKVAITDSDCPGQDCVHSGWISGPGRSLVCLPNRVEIRITGSSDVDFAVR